VEEAQAILEKAGWEKNAESGVYEREIDKETRPISLTLAVLNVPELTAAAERIAESWRAVGIQVELNVFESADLVQSVVRPRKFDVLLYGMVLGHELDLYAFWHSSQRNDPGLNIAQYADIEADALLEDMRSERDPVLRAEQYATFNTLAKNQRAALFLYMPDYVYVVRDDIHNLGLHPIGEAYERFNTIHTWYIDTDRVWPFIESLLR
jgi:peptide/nickel transport system substrate-binding protein